MNWIVCAFAVCIASESYTQYSIDCQCIRLYSDRICTRCTWGSRSYLDRFRSWNLHQRDSDRTCLHLKLSRSCTSSTESEEIYRNYIEEEPLFEVQTSDRSNRSEGCLRPSSWGTCARKTVSEPSLATVNSGPKRISRSLWQRSLAREVLWVNLLKKSFQEYLWAANLKKNWRRFWWHSLCDVQFINFRDHKPYFKLLILTNNY